MMKSGVQTASNHGRMRSCEVGISCLTLWAVLDMCFGDLMLNVL